MEMPKRPKPVARWDDPQSKWELNRMEDSLRLMRWADDMDAWLTETVLPVLLGFAELRVPMPAELADNAIALIAAIRSLKEDADV